MIPRAEPIFHIDRGVDTAWDSGELYLRDERRDYPAPNQNPLSYEAFLK